MTSRKTISIDTDAYQILVAAKGAPRASFSDAIRKMRANQRIRTFGELVKLEEELFAPLHLTKKQPRRRHAKKAVPVG
jgi:predicted CopG family antitoxin